MAENFSTGVDKGSVGDLEKSAKGHSPCSDLKDPLRRTLCRFCETPIVREAPFCKDYEPPVP